MSSSGARGLPEAKPAVALALLKRPAGNSRQAITAYYEKLYTVIGSPAFPIEPSMMRQRIQASIERGYHPTGTLRQMVAIAADDKRHDLLQQIKSPTLVIHGLCDVLVPPDHGRDVAKRIPGARFIGIEGMGHDLAPGAVAQWLPDLLKHLKHEHT
jgi:pimeloyl-ACP methyl ester carboxylesterase